VSSRIGRAIATSLKFYVSHSSATRYLRNGEKYYTYFIDNLLLFAAVKVFSKSFNSWWSYRKRFDSMFFLRHSVYLVQSKLVEWMVAGIPSRVCNVPQLLPWAAVWGGARLHVLAAAVSHSLPHTESSVRLRLRLDDIETEGREFGRRVWQPANCCHCWQVLTMNLKLTPLNSPQKCIIVFTVIIYLDNY